MSGARRAFASRANGRLSKGARTAGGLARNAQAAFRHGLNLPALLDATPEVERLAREIIATSALGPPNDALRAIASRIAEAMIDLRRVRFFTRPLPVRVE